MCSFAISGVTAVGLAVVKNSYINFILPTWVPYYVAYAKYCVWVRGGTTQHLNIDLLLLKKVVVISSLQIGCLSMKEHPSGT
jgi:hypothetical protein